METVQERFYELISRSGSDLDVVDLHYFGMGICSHYQKYLTWPNVRKHYKGFKTFLGAKSWIWDTIQHKVISKLWQAGDAEIVQRSLAQLLHRMQENQTNDENWRLRSFHRAFQNCFYEMMDLKIMSQELAIQIMEDSIGEQQPNGKIKKPEPLLAVPRKECKQFVKILLDEDKYTDIPILGDMCEEFGLPDSYGDHFRNGQVHTYGCRHLHAIMDKVK